jgi:thymidylate synthase
MEQYHELLKGVLGRGEVQFEPRTEEYILGISSHLSNYDLRKGFPLMTTKNVPPRLPFEELFWKLRGERNAKPLVDRNVNLWTANAFDRYLKTAGLRDKFPKHSQAWNEEFEKYKEKIAHDSVFAETAGDLGPVYGYQWRHWKDSSGKETDQLTKLLKGIKEKPGSRYHILSAWNVGDLPDMALGPCPFWHQFTVYGKNIDLTMVQRSCDVFLGVPFNIAQDSLLANMVANETGNLPRYFNHHYLNAHAYLGVPPRTDFWMDEKNVREFQGRFNVIHGHSSEYLDLKDWYLKNAPKEAEGNERKDHIPFILEQLSKTPGELPSIQIKRDVSLLEAIQMPALEYVKVIDYNPCKWDAKAAMAT